jgi:protein-S-isoprenylcysteine O-methyltransferase Ste14
MAATQLVLVAVGLLLVRREIWQAHILDVSFAHWPEGLLLPLAAIDGGITGTYANRLRNVEHLPAYRALLRWAIPLFLILYVACAALCARLMFGVFPVLGEFWRTLGFVLVVAGIAFRLWSQMVSPSALVRDAKIQPALESKAGGTAETTPTEPAITEEPKKESAPETSPGGEQPSSGNEPEKAGDESASTPTQEVAAFVDKIAEATSGQQAAANAIVDASGEQPLFPSGPYKWLRYPDATGRLIAFLGLPLCFNAWLPLLALPGVAVLIKWHISDQEAFRISQLGEKYLAYRQKTWNIVPYIY